MINLILFGPPGSGKGTQAMRIAEKYKLEHISTGDLFRYEISNKTELGKLAKSYMDQGLLVPDEVTIKMLSAKMARHPEANGFIFDGFPRTIPQAEALLNLLKAKGTSLSTMILLEVEEEEIIRRILLRGADSGRSDDSDVSVIKKRYGIYNKETQPVFQFFKERGRGVAISGIGEIEDIFAKIVTEINNSLNKF